MKIKTKNNNIIITDKKQKVVYPFYRVNMKLQSSSLLNEKKAFSLNIVPDGDYKDLIRIPSSKVNSEVIKNIYNDWANWKKKWGNEKYTRSGVHKTISNMNEGLLLSFRELNIWYPDRVMKAVALFSKYKENDKTRFIHMNSFFLNSFQRTWVVLSEKYFYFVVDNRSKPAPVVIFSMAYENYNKISSSGKDFGYEFLVVDKEGNLSKTFKYNLPDSTPHTFFNKEYDISKHKLRKNIKTVVYNWGDSVRNDWSDDMKIDYSQFKKDTIRKEIARKKPDKKLEKMKV